MFRAIDNFLNFIGASMRWLYGLMFQMVLLGENLTFDEFLNGSENKNDIVGKIGHRNANRLFGLLIVTPLILSALDKLGLI